MYVKKKEIYKEIYYEKMECDVVEVPDGVSNASRSYPSYHWNRFSYVGRYLSCYDPLCGSLVCVYGYGRFYPYSKPEIYSKMNQK